MTTTKKFLTTALTTAALATGLAACSDADTVSHNLSKDADNFKVQRRILFINGITDKYLLEIEGLCSLGNDNTDTQISVTCKTGKNEYKKHFLGISDNVTYLVEQLDGEKVSPDHYKVVFKPESVIPDVEKR